MQSQNSWFRDKKSENAHQDWRYGGFPSPPQVGRNTRCERPYVEGSGRQNRALGKITLFAAGAAAVFFLSGNVALSAQEVTSRPCEKHEGAAKRACVKQLKRDKMAWPPRPSEAEIKKRVGWNWAKALRVAYCETGGNWQHYPHGTYVGGLGMYRGTYAYGQRVTGYRWPSEGATRAEQIAVAVASHPITHGWSGWGCGGA